MVLPAPLGPSSSEDLAAFDDELYVIDRDEFCEAPHEVVHLDDRVPRGTAEALTGHLPRDNSSNLDRSECQFSVR